MAATEAATKATTNTTDESWLETHPYPRIFYDEPEPEDRLQQFPALFRVVALLYELFMDRPDVFSTGGGFIFYDETNGNRRVAPDFLITFDVDSAWDMGKPTQLPDMGDWQASPFRHGSGVS